MFSLEISDKKNTDAREKNNHSLVENSSTNAVFDWDFDGRKWIGGVSELKVWISSEIKIKSTFLNIWTVTEPMHA